MYCTNCGAELEDDSKFCTSCGCRLDGAAEEPEMGAGTGAGMMETETMGAGYASSGTENTSAQGAYQPFEFSTDAAEGELGSGSAEPKKKLFGGKKFFGGKKASGGAQPFGADPLGGAGDSGAKKPFGGKKFVIAAGAVVAAAVVIGFGAPKAAHFVRATVLSPKSYYQYIEKKEAEKLADMVSSYYNAYVLNTLDGASGGDAKLSLEIGEDVQDLVSLAGVDISWLDKVSIGVSGASKDKVAQSGLSLGVNGTDLANLNIVVDTENMDFYAQIPELSKTYLGVSLADLDAYATREGKEVLDTLDELKEVLPSEKEVHDLVEKYAKIAIKNIDTVKRDKSKLKAGDVSQTCTVLKVTLDEEMVEAIVEDILSEIPKDKQLEKVLKRVMPFYQKSIAYYGAKEQDAEELYDTFIDEIERLQDDMNINLHGDKIIWKVYVDGKSAVRGRTLTVNNDTLTYAMPRKGSKFGLLLEVKDKYDTLSFSGSGKCSGDTIKGDFVFNYEMDILDIALEKFDLAALKKGYPNGTITVKVAKGLTSQMSGIGQIGVDNLTKNLLSKYALVLDLETAEKKLNAKLSVKDSKDTVCALGFELKRNNDSKASVPSSGKTIFVEDMSDLGDWFKTVEFDALMTKLENKLQIPSEYLDYLEQLISYAKYFIG